MLPELQADALEKAETCAKVLNFVCRFKKFKDGPVTLARAQDIQKKAAGCMQEILE